jgi:hypothetical protein
MKLKFFFLLLLTFYIVNCTFYIEAQATIRYVSKTGTSTPPYTSWATAADSIQKCINICSFGDTVYVANGIYKERVDMIPGLSLIGAGSDSCLVDTRQLANHNYSIRVTDSCYLAGFQTLTFDNTYGNGIYIYDVNINNIYATIKFMKVTNAQTGFRISSSSLNFDDAYKLIKNNVISDIDIGINCILTTPIIENNIILYPVTGGLNAGINSSPSFINNTIIMENATNISTGFGDGWDIISKVKGNLFISLDNSGEFGIDSYADTLLNNIVLGNWQRGISTAGVTGYDAVVKNNHLEKNINALRYDVGSGGTAPVFHYNNLWNNQNNYLNFSNDSTNIYSNPMFVNEDSSDFHLQKYSPLVDAGDPTILDKDRSRSDIGIYGGPFGESYKYIDLAPAAPLNLTALVDSNYITLNWNRNSEADTSFYNVYRDTVINFTIDSTKLISSSVDTFFAQINPHNVIKYVYKVTCVDKQGNESEPSEEKVVNITGIAYYPQLITDYQLYQNYPNPFNPSTTISYRLKQRGYVKLYVYDIKGELVSVLVNNNQEAGFYEVEFTTNNLLPTTNNLASGIYIYQIMIRSENNIPVFTDMKKMIFLK